MKKFTMKRTLFLSIYQYVLVCDLSVTVASPTNRLRYEHRGSDN
jgi:hypothetical protein